MEPIKRCTYRNCTHTVEGKSNKKFCCDNHRKMEYTYIKRDRWERKKIAKMIFDASQIDNTKILDLYKMIYN